MPLPLLLLRRQRISSFMSGRLQTHLARASRGAWMVAAWGAAAAAATRTVRAVEIEASILAVGAERE